MFGSTELAAALNVSAITSTLDAYGVGKAIFQDTVVPSDFAGDKSILYYMTNPRNMTDPIEFYTWTINCRDNDYTGALAIANTVINTINLVSYNNYYIYCTILPTVTPANDTDKYNTPIEALLKIK